MRSFIPSDLSNVELHGILLGSIGPRPIAFASTVNSEGVANLSPFSYFNIFSANPPILIFSPARRGRDNTTKHSYENAKAHPEVVINIVDFSIVQQMSLSSTEYPEGVNEFEKAGLTAIPSDMVKPPRVKESPVQYECKVNEIVELGKEGGAGNLIICEIVKIHVREDLINEELQIDQTKIDTVGRMGGDYYTRAHGAALFEVAKPLRTMGIGVDQIPAEIRNSSILTGNDLGRLGNVEELPNETDVNEYRLTELSDIFVALEDSPHKLEKSLHEKAQELLSKGNVHEAWMTLMSFNN
ncbi:MAG: flavin reductase (DIM6/NTAB) family NADH-FMN oxidoreductase RutF [Flammeovirgaceae bacterium]|jgi:flavin reductase (DIM6/NTAB) family NADH-FMN oxidoreductase RutF